MNIDLKLYAQAVKVVAKFKDFSKRRRPVSHVSWQKQAPVLAVSHCSPGTVSLVACWPKSMFREDFVNIFCL